MKFKGKLFGALFGLMFFGPIGLALGFIFGHLYDLGYFQAFADITRGHTHTESQQIFFNTTFKIMGYIAKSDGRVSENEIEAAKNIMSELGLNESQKHEAIQLFALGKEKAFNMDHALFELRQTCHYQPILLQLFLDIQIKMATADGALSPAKRETLKHICLQLGLSTVHFNEHENRYQQQYQRYYQHQHTQSRPRGFSVDASYQILGVSNTATPDEIKKAYRRLMSQNHPDKLIAKGLPPEMIKVATQKTQKIKQAYELIKKTKNF